MCTNYFTTCDSVFQTLIMSFVPDTFEPAGILNMLHRQARFVSSNDIVTIVGNTINNSTSESSSDVIYYGIGAASGTTVLLVVFIIWLFAICCVSCCRNACCRDSSNKVPSVLFIVFIAGSIFGFFYSIGGSVQANNGATIMLDQIDILNDMIKETLDDANNIVSYVESVELLTNQTQDSCAALFNATNGAIVFPDADLGDLSGSLNDTLAEATSQIRDVSKILDDIVDESAPYLSAWRTYYIFVIIPVLVIVGIFTLSTIWRLFDKVPGAGSTFARTLNKGSGIFLFTFGIIMLVVIWIFVVSIGTTTVVGSDFCVPNPLNTINSIAAISTDTYVVGQDYCDVITSENELFCYYQSCNGLNPISQNFTADLVLSDSVVQLLGDLSLQINETIANITATNPGALPADANDCASNVQALTVKLLEANGLIDDALDFLECKNINPILTDMFYTGLCNGLVAGLGIMWVTLATGAMTLMGAMFMFRLFQFGEQYSDYPNGAPEYSNTQVGVEYVDGLDYAAKPQF